MTNSPMRLSDGGVINRAETLKFSFDGKEYAGHPGDSLASALLANDVKIVGRGFKYHRPRGVMSAGQEEGGAILTVGTGARREPNVKATMQPLFNGLESFGQNAWPSVARDVGRINDFGSRFLGAGFYYKTFFGLRGGTKDWMLFEKLIRKAAGMGVASREPDPAHYETGHASCDILVVGSGPAGLAAAKQAAETGLDVILAEQDFAFGGDYLSQPGGASTADETVEKLAALGVTMMLRTQVFGLYDGCVAGLIESVTDQETGMQVRQRTWIVRPRQIIIATGAIERPIAFGNNDRPGIMSSSGLRTYLNRYAVKPGQEAIIATTNDSGYATAADLKTTGARVTLLDARTHGPDAPEGVEVLRGRVPVKGEGFSDLEGLQIGKLSEFGEVRIEKTVDCDLAAISGGWSPVVNLTSHRGVKPIWNEELDCFLPGATNEPIKVCGSAAGLWEEEDCTMSGAAAGAEAARDIGANAPVLERPERRRTNTPTMALYEVTLPNKKLKSFVDPQHDVTTGDIRLAHQEGFVSVEHMKRYTTLGMATDQGKVGNVIGIALMAAATGAPVSKTGTTTFRPPYSPISIGALAGRSVKQHFRPNRLTPLDSWNKKHGAVMTQAGLWWRPWYYPVTPNESVDDAYEREMKVTRESVGLCDVSSLGKIMVQGPDAGEFLNRLYVNGFGKLAVGKARYGIMLREDGIVYDDGTTWRLAENEFLMTTTTANAAGVMTKLEEYLQTRWPGLKVSVASVSDQWAGVAVAGPKSREVLEAVVSECDLSNEAFPFMGVREAVIAGKKIYIARISFSGERAYEVYVRSGDAEPVADALWGATEPLGGCLYGTEALGAMRIEKGHVAGSELDGRTTLEDLGLGKMASSKKAYIGKALATREGLQDPDRQTLVGVIPTGEGKRLRAGALLMADTEQKGHGEGLVTAVTYSVELGHWIGLGLIKGGVERWDGKTAISADPVRDGNTEVRIVSPHFLDPKGERMHG